MQKSNFNSKRWFSTVFMLLIYAFLMIKGATVGFPHATEQIIWSYIQHTFTPMIFGLVLIFIGAETYIKAKNNK